MALQYTGFTGCIRDIYDNGDMYDLNDPVKVENAPKGCELARPCADCPKDRGYCEPRWNEESICVCDMGYTGSSCSDSKCCVPLVTGHGLGVLYWVLLISVGVGAV